MEDSRTEQDRLLEDVLGFNPNEQALGSTDERDQSPLQKVAQAAGIPVKEMREKFLTQERGYGYGNYHLDPDNLLKIQTGTNFSRTRREYFRWDGRQERFTKAIESEFENESSYIHHKTEYVGEEGEKTTIYFVEKGRLSIYRNTEGGQVVNLSYNSDGSLNSIEPGDMGWLNTRIARNKDNGKYEFQYKENDDKANHDMTKNIPIKFGGEVLMDWQVSEDGTKINITMRKDGEITNELSFPTHLSADVATLKEDMYPDELLKNPGNPDINLDEGAKLADPYKRIGATWEVLDRKKADPAQPRDMHDSHFMMEEGNTFMKYSHESSNETKAFETFLNGLRKLKDS